VLVRLARKFNSAFRLSPFVLMWFPIAWVLLGLFRGAILTFKFKNLSPLFGHADGISTAVPLVSQQQYTRAMQIYKLIGIAAKNTPWVSNCFPQAIVARLFLGLYRVPYALYFGLHREAPNEGLQAHAWVASGPCNVTGKNSFDGYTVVASYGSQSWNRDLKIVGSSPKLDKVK
jgi:hypothetical protein